MQEIDMAGTTNPPPKISLEDVVDESNMSEQRSKKPLASFNILFDPQIYAAESSSEDEKEDKSNVLPTINSEDYSRKIATTISSAKTSAALRKGKTRKYHVEGTVITPLKHRHILEDYNVMLNLTDVSYGDYGHEKFYLLQVLEADKKKNYYVFARWGWVGADNAQTSLKKFGKNKEAAIEEFEKEFLEKTLNEWKDRKAFNPVEGKYVLTQAEGLSTENIPEELIKEQETLKLSLEEAWKKPSNIIDSVKELMKTIWNLNKIENTMKELSFDRHKFPLKKLSKDRIQKAFAILNKIQELLIANKVSGEVINTLSNDFYTLIPQIQLTKTSSAINHIQRLREKIMVLELLNDILFAYNSLVTVGKSVEEKSIADVLYESLQCIIRPVMLYSPLAGIITDSICNAHGSAPYKLNVKEIYGIEKSSEDMLFFPFTNFPNKKFLWNGNMIVSLPKILMQSLKIPAPEIPSARYLFGKGIYFYDIASKAANACRPSKENPEVILILCEVALGNVKEVYAAKAFKRPPTGYHSVKGVAKLCPDINYCNACEELASGDAKIDLGRVDKNKELGNMTTELQYNEYVIYDYSQVRMRYLVKCYADFSVLSEDNVNA